MAVWALSLSTTDLSTRRVSAEYYSPVFGVWFGLVSRWGPLADPVLYPRGYSFNALPK